LSRSDKNVAVEQQKRIERAPPFLEDADVRNTWLSPAHHTPAPKALTSREREIIDLIGRGHASKQIADALRISANTVNNHRASILAKLGAHSAIDALRIYQHIK
jgi:DNA-binding NarL/FixJ family response regulator